ncbi:Uncharacterised protein [Bordetella pertussis]|nr:Uncharacterised protein [Bordetella pertussis]
MPCFFPAHCTLFFIDVDNVQYTDYDFRTRESGA